LQRLFVRRGVPFSRRRRVHRKRLRFLSQSGGVLFAFVQFMCQIICAPF
jgi:hypothetical protein